MKRVALGSLLAAIVVFFWGFVYWTLLPFPKQLIHPIADEASFTQILNERLPESGVYNLPDQRASSASEYNQRFSSGPVALVVFRKAGADPTSIFVGGFLHMLVSALLMGVLLRMASPALGSYSSRVGFVILAGFAGAVFSDLRDAIWFLQPWGYHVLQLMYDATSWVWTGLILARFVRPRP